jgi:hypothetical protein
MKLLTITTVLLAASPAVAEPALDAEIDPTAYALSGHSLHVGLGREHLRLDVGAFAMTVPEAIHGQTGFQSSFEGYGAKLQYFVNADRRGPFAGIEAAYDHLLVEHGDAAFRDSQLDVGIQIGWRFSLTRSIYATPWLGVGHVFGADDAMVGGARWEAQRWTVFPAVHVGYELR